MIIITVFLHNSITFTYCEDQIIQDTGDVIVLHSSLPYLCVL